MYLRQVSVKNKNAKNTHKYWVIVRSVRLKSKSYPIQKIVKYLGKVGKISEEQAITKLNEVQHEQELLNQMRKESEVLKEKRIVLNKEIKERDIEIKKIEVQIDRLASFFKGDRSGSAKGGRPKKERKKNAQPDLETQEN